MEEQCTVFLAQHAAAIFRAFVQSPPTALPQPELLAVSSTTTQELSVLAEYKGAVAQQSPNLDLKLNVIHIGPRCCIVQAEAYTCMHACIQCQPTTTSSAYSGIYRYVESKDREGQPKPHYGTTTNTRNTCCTIWLVTTGCLNLMQWSNGEMIIEMLGGVTYTCILSSGR